jgi:FtsP/CotA-like multicopper oxidase with cupredoxin domain
MTALDDRPDTASGGDDDGSDDNGSSGGVSALVYLAITGVLIALVLGVFAVGLVALIRDDSGGDGGGSASTELNVQLSEFAITGDLTAPEGDVTLDVVNAGSIEHNLAVRDTDLTTPNLQSRGVATLPLGELSAGSYELYCTIAGHAESGMVAELMVVEGEVPAGEGSASVAGDGASESEFDGDEMDRIMVESMLAFPAETEGKGNVVLEPTILEDGTKQFELTAAITPWEVSPGEFVDAWTYNGIVPGPQIKVDIGDTVQVILHNETPMGTDIHWHGIHTPNDQDGVAPFTQDPIKSGETFTYEFVAEDPAIGMYHAHLHSQVSVINGMFAAFTIGDNPLPLGQTVSGVTIPEDLEPVFEEPMVLNDAGVIGLTLNGKSFPATEPLVMTEGDWGVIHYYNEGLTAHPMHMHQFPQLVYAKDGIPLDNPYWADTINVAPGERYSVLFQADTPGTWVYHCHILTHVEREEGMFGMVTALVVQEEA